MAELEWRWRQQEGTLGDEQTEGLQPAAGGDSSGPPGQDVTKRLHLLLCGGELLGKSLQTQGSIEKMAQI